MLSKVGLRFEQLEEQDNLTALELYQQYCNYLRERSGKEIEIHSLQTGVIRYLVPVLGGPVPSHKRSTPAEIQAGFDYLQTITLEQLLQSIDRAKAEPNGWHPVQPPHRSLSSRLKSWQHWIVEQYRQNEIEKEVTPEFNTFYNRGTKRQLRKPGQKLHENSCPAHAFCAKEFPDDYINPILQEQFDHY